MATGDKFSGGLDQITREGAKQLFSNIKSAIVGIAELPGKMFGGEDEKGAEVSSDGRGAGSFMSRMMAAITGESLDVKQPQAQAAAQEITPVVQKASQYECDHNDIVCPAVPNMRSGGVGMSAPR